MRQRSVACALAKWTASLRGRLAFRCALHLGLGTRRESGGDSRCDGKCRTINDEMAKKTVRVRPALSPALTELARQLQAETPGFVPLRPGEHRSVDDYTVNHYWDGPKRKAKGKNTV